MRYSILLLFLISCFALSQTIDKRPTAEWFAGTSLADSVKNVSGRNHKALYSTSSADTIVSGTLFLDEGGNDITFWGTITNISGSMNTKMQLGVYGDPEFGYQWYDMVTATADTSFFFNVAEQSWGPYLVSMEYAIRIVRTGVQRNWYAIKSKQFKQ